MVDVVKHQFANLILELLTESLNKFVASALSSFLVSLLKISNNILVWILVVLILILFRHGEARNDNNLE